MCKQKIAQYITHQLQVVVEFSDILQCLYMMLCTHVNSAHLFVIILVLSLPLSDLRFQFLGTLFLFFDLFLDVFYKRAEN